jgi:hypothetical protein
LEWLQEQDRLRERNNVKTPLDDSEEAKARRKQESKERRLKKREGETAPTGATADETKEEKPAHATPTDVRIYAYFPFITRRCAQLGAPFIMDAVRGSIQMSKIDALAEATKLVRVLEKSSADKLHTHVLAVQVYLRAGTLASR